ncbi:hypothetical protein LSG31_08190 [Fodinisporobacter ferrooxydans]|uniref:Uncharacterized protein n=1 Tax=Fodinisporobacter ferrooxydans TaxID=2901836 RepID=A0ABY4CSF6_9BACL|nr:hypothetical protein LSG31_08190 [Alicyclobacillaceae bacterium MYW30-H2]
MKIIITDNALQLLKSYGWSTIRIESPKTVKSAGKHGSSIFEEPAKVLEGIPRQEQEWDVHIVSSITVYTSKHLKVKDTLTIDEIHDGEHRIFIAKGYEATINE